MCIVSIDFSSQKSPRDFFIPIIKKKKKKKQSKKKTDKQYLLPSPFIKLDGPLFGELFK